MVETTELIVLAFGQEDKAGQVQKTIQHMIDQGRLSILNAAVLVKHADGKTWLKDMQEVGAVRGAVFGAIVGGLIGLVAGPVGAVLGTVAGATTGGVAGHTIDSGFPNDYLVKLQRDLHPGSSALIVLTRAEWSDRLVEAVAPAGGRVFRHVLKDEIGAYLAASTGLDTDSTPAAELPAKLEAQIATWQTKIEALMAKSSANGAIDLAETEAKLTNLRTMQRLAQEKLRELLTAEVQSYTEQIEAWQAKVNVTPEPERAELLAKLEATRAKRKAVRHQLYAQIDSCIKSWQIEIEALNASLAKLKPDAPEATNPAVATLERFSRLANEQFAPSSDEKTELSARIAALQARVDTAEMELQNQREAQLAAWQAAITDLQAYAATPAVADYSEVTGRIAVLQEQVAAEEAALKTQLAAQIATWQAEAAGLQRQLTEIETAVQAKVNEQIAPLQKKIDQLRAEAAETIAAQQQQVKERVAAVQARTAAAQAQLEDKARSTGSVS